LIIKKLESLITLNLAIFCVADTVARGALGWRPWNTSGKYATKFFPNQLSLPPFSEYRPSEICCLNVWQIRSSFVPCLKSFLSSHVIKIKLFNLIMKQFIYYLSFLKQVPAESNAEQIIITIIKY